MRGWAYKVISLSATAFTIQNILPLNPFLLQQAINILGSFAKKDVSEQMENMV